MILVNTWKGLFSLLIIFLLQNIFPLSNYAMKNMLSFEMEHNFTQFKPDHILTITGTASQRLDTNVVILSISIQTVDISLSESYRKNTISSNRVTAILKENQIPDRNVTTRSYYIQKQFKTIFIPSNRTTVEVFEGFKIVNALDIRLSDANKVPNLIDNLIRAENVLVNRVSFQLSKGLRKLVSDRLLRQAAEDALERASVTADTLDLTIDDIKRINVRENYQIWDDGVEESVNGDIGIRRAGRAASAPRIFSGTSNIETRMLVDFIIKKSS